MTQTGYLAEYSSKTILPATKIEEQLRAEYRNSIYKKTFLHSQITTNSAVDFEEKASQTIGTAGTTALTIVAATSHDSASYRGQTITLVYKNNTGTEKTSTATFNAVNSTTEVAFDPAVADFYEAVSLTSSVAPGAGHTFGIGPTENLTYGIIRETATSATAADLYGVGSIVAKGSADQAADRNKTVYLTYLNNLGSVETATATTNSTNSTTAVRFFKSDGSAVNNFYRIRTLSFAVNATGNILLYDKTGSTTIYGVIKSGNFQSLHAKLYPRSGAYVVPIIRRAFTTQLTYGSIIRFTYTIDTLEQIIDIFIPPYGIRELVLPQSAANSTVNVAILAATNDQQGTVSAEIELLEVIRNEYN